MLSEWTLTKYGRRATGEIKNVISVHQKILTASQKITSVDKCHKRRKRRKKFKKSNTVINEKKSNMASKYLKRKKKKKKNIIILPSFESVHEKKYN